MITIIYFIELFVFIIWHNREYREVDKLAYMKNLIITTSICYLLVIFNFINYLQQDKMKYKETTETFITIDEQKEEPNRIYCTFNISFYDACIECCGKEDGICANGEQGIPWKTCAAPDSVPFGSIIHIEGLGDFIVTDRGKAIVQDGNTYCIDIYVSNHEEALGNGRQYKEGYIELEDYYGY